MHVAVGRRDAAWVRGPEGLIEKEGNSHLGKSGNKEGGLAGRLWCDLKVIEGDVRVILMLDLKATKGEGAWARGCFLRGNFHALGL